MKPIIIIALILALFLVGMHHVDQQARRWEAYCMDVNG
jgi:hypothetical protein